MDENRTVERYIIEDSTLSDDEKIERLAFFLDPENWASYERLSVEVEEDFIWDSVAHTVQPDEYRKRILDSAYEIILSRHPELSDDFLDDDDTAFDDSDGDDGLPF